MTELKKCPFCGSSDLKLEVFSVCGGHGIYYDKFYVYCKSCHAEGPSFDNYYASNGLDSELKIKALEAWNVRFTEVTKND